MQNIIKQVYDFNQKAGLLSKGYSDTLESAFQIEEALEGFSYLEKLYFMLDPIDEISANKQARDVSRLIVHLAKEGDLHSDSSFKLADVDRLDKACDAIIFAIGSMAKLDLSIEQSMEALNTVIQANLQKLDMPKDSHGKLTKPQDFIGPETKLQQILDERKKD